MIQLITLLALSRFDCLVQILIEGTPKYELSLIPALELPMIHLQNFNKSKNFSGDVFFINKNFSNLDFSCCS